MTETLGRLWRRLRSDARGLTTVEYTIVLCLIAALCVSVWKTFGDNLHGYITSSTTEIETNLTQDK